MARTKALQLLFTFDRIGLQEILFLFLKDVFELVVVAAEDEIGMK